MCLLFGQYKVQKVTSFPDFKVRANILIKNQNKSHVSFALGFD
jgi:hypothetical protein